MKRILFWFRRDLRLKDNKGLYEALSSADEVIPVFIFDDEILKELESDDPRVNFIYDSLAELDIQLRLYGSGLFVYRGQVLDELEKMIVSWKPDSIFFNHDYEPYALERDENVRKLCQQHAMNVQSFKDQVIFEKGEVVKPDGLPYTVFTPYSKKWKARIKSSDIQDYTDANLYNNFIKQSIPLPSIESLQLMRNRTITVRPINLSRINHYSELRNFPSQDSGSYLSPHLRFGTISIREVMRQTKDTEVFLNELIWREFFMQILFHFPIVVSNSFKVKYDRIVWRNNAEEFDRWCNGTTGYPMVDAGMRELNATGYMHNRVRMVTASFLCKHLLIDWRWGEAYFAKKLLDYELASNNGNWQWAAGTGCDAAPYFRVFNPSEQVIKFDKDFLYIMKWVPEFNSFSYHRPMVDHSFARNRALQTYKTALE